MISNSKTNREQAKFDVLVHDNIFVRPPGSKFRNGCSRIYVVLSPLNDIHVGTF